MPHQRSDRLVLLATAAILLALGVHFASAADSAAAVDNTKYDLRYKLSTGTVLRYSIDHRAAIRSTIDETTQEAQTKTQSVKAWKVIDVLPQGEIEFMNVVESVHMVNRLPDRAPVEYNSKTDKVPPPGYEDAARAVGIPLSVVRMTPRGKIISHNVKHRQPAADKDAQLVIRLPDEPVAVGATWDEPFDVTAEVDSGGTKAIQTRRHYELTSVASGIATIEVNYQVLSPIDSKIEAQLVQKLMKGKVRFDIKQGRIESQLFDVDKRVLGFAGPTSSMHYLMRMEEHFTDAKLAAAATLKQSSVLKQPLSATKRDAAPRPSATPRVASQPQVEKQPPSERKSVATAPRNMAPTRRPAARSANRNNFGKPTQHR